MTSSVNLNRLDLDRYRSWSLSLYICATCGLCASLCPVSGIDGFDPCKLVRMVRLGLHKDVIDSRWPWICTMCGKCEHLCPMAVDITEMVRKVRSLRERQKVPGELQKGLAQALKTGNIFGLPKEDYIFILEDVAAEIAEEPGFSGFTVPIDKKGANLLITIHNKLVNTRTEDLKHLWKILYAAGEDWTVPSNNWEGCNWAYFTGEDAAVRILLDRLVEHMHRLKINHLLYPE